jgi:hypothetical protein
MSIAVKRMAKIDRVDRKRRLRGGRKISGQVMI